MTRPLKHIYLQDEGAKFLRGEVATAACGFVAEGKGEHSDVWCMDCRENAGLTATTESW